jgi:hypothetical protein
VRVFSWGQGDEGVRGEWSEVLGGVGGLALEGGLWAVGEVFEGRRGQRGLWGWGRFLRAGGAKGGCGWWGRFYERGVPLGGGGVGFSRWDAGGGRECRRA